MVKKKPSKFVDSETRESESEMLQQLGKFFSPDRTSNRYCTDDCSITPFPYSQPAQLLNARKFRRNISSGSEDQDSYLTAIAVEVRYRRHRRHERCDAIPGLTIKLHNIFAAQNCSLSRASSTSTPLHRPIPSIC